METHYHHESAEVMKRPNFRMAVTLLIAHAMLVALVQTQSLGQTSAVDSSTSKASTSVASYDPMKIDTSKKPQTLLFEFEYQPKIKLLRKGDADSVATTRKVPVKVYLPSEAVAPVVFFSHGLGGSREGFKHGGEHWAARGYVAIFLQHPGSDESVWRDKAIGQRMNSAREAASAQNLLYRIEDVEAAIDYLEKVERSETSVATEAKQLKSRIDLDHIGMSGHSFGAITTQMVSGQSPALPTQQPTDNRIRAALVLSPSPPKIGQAERYFAKVSIPWMLMTGTKDDSPIGEQSAESRLSVFPALPAGNKYQVVFDGGTHAFLGERGAPTSGSGAQFSHARATVALSTAFWDTYLKGDEAARQWLNGDGPKTILSDKDLWQTK